MGSTFQVTATRWLRHSHLCEIADNADNWDYNRQLCSEAVRTVPSDLRFPLLGHLYHHHRMMKPCEPHVRLLIGLEKGMCIADVPCDYFDALPVAYVVRTGEKIMGCATLDERGDPEHVSLQPGDGVEVRRALRMLANKCRHPNLRTFVKRALKAEVH